MPTQRKRRPRRGRLVDLIPSASDAETAEFLAGASGWYDYEPNSSLALRVGMTTSPIPRWRFGLV